MSLSVEGKRCLLEKAAKDAYAIFAHRSGMRPAWEELNQAHRMAWEEVVQNLLDDGDCLQCGDPLICQNCNADDDEPECLTCGRKLKCPVCQAEEIAAAQLAAKEIEEEK